MQLAHPAAKGWTAALASARPWHPAVDRALVIVPHPDDEAAMFGGLIAFAIRCGASVDLLAVTDGEAAYPERVPPDLLAVRRRCEQAAACETLGIAPSKITRMGFPDGGVAEREDELTDVIATRLDADDLDLLVAPWEHDHHTDHEACGRAARRAVGRSHRSITSAFGLFWSLLREEPAPDIELRAVELTTWEMARKRSAIDHHASQITSLVAEQPMLGAPELAITRWPREHYLVVSP